MAIRELLWVYGVGSGSEVNVEKLVVVVEVLNDGVKERILGQIVKKEKKINK